MKIWKILLISIAVASDSSFAEPQLVDKVVAVVNDNVILESNITNLTKLVRLNVNLEEKNPDKIILRHQILNRLILDEIVLQIGHKIGITVTKEELNQEITKIAKRHNMSINQMYHYISHNGINYGIYRKQVCREIMISKVCNNEVRCRITILQKELNAVFKEISKQNDNTTEVNLSHILISLPSSPTISQITNAEIKAQCIINKVRHGADFDKIAITSTANQPILKRKQKVWESIQNLPFIFRNPLSTAKKGNIIGPIYSEDGLYILKINDLRDQNYDKTITKIHARHILLKPSSFMTENQVLVNLQQIFADIKNCKTSFSNEAKRVSQDLNSAKFGGDLGWRSIDSYDPVFFDVLTKLNKGQISDPVRSSLGWHLIEVLDSKSTNKKTPITCKIRAYQIVLKRKFSEEAIAWMQEQCANAYIKILEN